MGQVSISLNGRTYRLYCGEGEEERLLELASHVRKKMEGLAAEFGQVGDDRLLLMSAVLIADELWDARDKITGLVLAQSEKGADKSRSRGKGLKADIAVTDDPEPAAADGDPSSGRKFGAA